MDVENTNGIQSDLIRGHINTIILNILYENDRYGYEILQQIELKSNGQYILKQPTLYSALKRLEQLDFVTSYWGSGMSNGGRRKYFQITDKGREFVQQNRAEWEYSRTIIDNLVSDKIFDFDRNSAPSTIDFTALKKRQARPLSPVEEKDTQEIVTQRYEQQIEKNASVSQLELQAENFLQPMYSTAFVTTTATIPAIENTSACHATNTNTVADNTPSKDNTTEQIIQSVVESNATSQEPTSADSTIAIDNTTEQIIQSIVESNATSQEPTSADSAVVIDNTTEQIIQSIAESNATSQDNSPLYSSVDTVANTTTNATTQNNKVWHRDTGYTTNTSLTQNRQNSYTTSHSNEPVDLERMKLMHENYLKLIGDFEALQTQYIYTMLENENPNFAKVHTRHTPYIESTDLAFDLYTLESLSCIPYTSDTVWASSLKDDSIHLQEVPTKDSMQENLLEQLPQSYLEEDRMQNTVVEEQVQDKYTDLNTAPIYNSLQEEVTENFAHAIEDADFIYDVLEEDKRSRAKKGKKRTWFVNTSYNKLFVVLSSILFVLALAECLAIYFIGAKLNVNFQFALSVAILYTVVYILATLLASKPNAKQTLITIAQKKYMWYTLLFYGIALIISVVTLYLLTKTFESPADFWFYTLSFNILTFNIPLLSILYCWCVSFKQNAKKDTL